jgi:type VI secretion system secreted protein Hcp
MAQDIFLKINGIEGESADDKHKNEIDVLSYSWIMEQQSTMSAGGGGGSGKATVHDLEFNHFYDKASLNLAKYCLTGKHIAEAKLTVRKAGGTPMEYLVITMSDVIITYVGQSADAKDEIKVMEKVRMSFAKVKLEYKVQNAQGGSAGVVTATYDIKLNKDS